MSTTSATLPAGWETFLEDVNRRLESALALADGRIAQAPASDAGQRAEERRQDVARLEWSLQGLGARLESTQRLVEEIDGALQAGEESLRQQAASCADVRARLAQWAGRAIG